MAVTKAQLSKAVKSGKLTKNQLLSIYKNPLVFLEPYQVPPTTEWRECLFCGGRGSGKSYTGLIWILSKILLGAKVLAIVGPDFNTVENVLVREFIKLFPPNKQPIWNTQSKIIYPEDKSWIVYVYTSTADIRGPNLEFCFCDEIVKWCEGLSEKILERYNVMDYAVRIHGKAGPPQIFIASTPKPIKWFRNFEKQVADCNPLYAIMRATTHDNPHLPPSFTHAMERKYGGTRFGDQELLGKVNYSTLGALWNQDLIDRTRARCIPQVPGNERDPYLFFSRVVISVDPSTTSGDESDPTGIIIAGLGQDGHGYLLEDCSGTYSPLETWTLVNDKYNEYRCDSVIVETNNGRDYVINAMKGAFGINAPYIKDIFAKQGKIVRARPVVGIHEQERIHFIGSFETLENQMCNYTGTKQEDSPGNLDAFVYAMTELMIEHSIFEYDTYSCPMY